MNVVKVRYVNIDHHAIQDTRYIEVLILFLTQASVIVSRVIIHRTLVTVLSQKRVIAIAVASKIVTITSTKALTD